MNFYGSLEGIEGFGRLTGATIATLGFRDLVVHNMCRLGEDPPGEDFLYLCHQADWPVLIKGCGSSFFREHGNDGFLPYSGSVGRIIVSVIREFFKQGRKFLDLAEREGFKNLGWDAVFSGSSVVGDGGKYVTDIIWMAFEWGVVGSGGSIEDVPGELMYLGCFVVITVVQGTEERAERLTPVFTVGVAFKFVGNFGGGGGCGRGGKNPSCVP